MRKVQGSNPGWGSKWRAWKSFKAVLTVESGNVDGELGKVLYSYLAE